jgi:hypothetical protein
MKNNIGRIFFALAMIVSLTGAFTSAARADEWRDHERDAHEWHHHHMHRHDRPVIVQQPNVVYAPPVIIQAPVADAGSPGFNITIPINFR